MHFLVQVVLPKDIGPAAPVFQQLPAAWVWLAGTLFCVVVLSVITLAPISWLYGEWALRE